MDTSLIDGLQRALADHCTPEHIRNIEGGASPQALWETIESLGYADAFVSSECDGIDLPFSEAFPLGYALGYAGYPLPLLETAVARALLTNAGYRPPAGPIVLADSSSGTGGGVAVASTPGLRSAAHLLLRHEGMWHLLPLDASVIHPGPYRPQLSGSLDSVDLARTGLHVFPAPHSAATLTAPLHAAEMAGSMAAVLDMTLAYAGDRRQFGRAIGQFQALQQEISAMGEQVAFATMAARLGCGGSIQTPDELRAASAKLSTCDATERVVSIAHAVHGAIGITEEYALGIHARRLHEWRGAGATAGTCAGRLGSALLERSGSLLEFVREALPAA